ncbi:MULTISPECIES: TetR/AcrR family transcriptional regulator [unclassified Nocardioides]|uniref:TetR/AcrR family transcriptional regulator n=1 Tax=unclassified Nocardioides TaxID=2615069 RepID=UPI001910ECA4|nr:MULTISPECIES: TetR/AcrR family transcriptional regulator [unclassified Nocardioides]
MDADHTRRRLSQDERRRQLLGIGLRMLVEKPIQDLSIDAVATEAGISRGLLFHYFPTKTDYYDAVIGAALRRVMRNTAPDEGVSPELACEQFVSRVYAQIERRREFYVALVFGNGTIAVGGNRLESHRMTVARRLIAALRLGEDTAPVVHAWTAYVEDRALLWSGSDPSERVSLEDDVTHCCRALDALLAV